MYWGLGVDGGARSEDQPLDAVSNAVLQDVDGPDDVHARIDLRSRHRVPNAGLGSVVVDDVRLLAVEDIHQPIRVGDIDLVHPGLRVHAIGPTLRQVVYDYHLVAVPNEHVDDVGGDESSASGYKNLHAI